MTGAGTVAGFAGLGGGAAGAAGFAGTETDIGATTFACAAGLGTDGAVVVDDLGAAGGRVAAEECLALGLSAAPKLLKIIVITTPAKNAATTGRGFSRICCCMGGRQNALIMAANQNFERGRPAAAGWTLARGRHRVNGEERCLIFLIRCL